MSADPREIIARSPMSRAQFIVVALMVGLNALDGYDVLSISWAAPGIAEEWGIGRDALGIVLSMELVGMALGSVLLGGVADKIGRRPTMLGCLAVMTAGMYMVTTVSGLYGLSFWRVITGLGIGGLLAAITAVTAEFSNTRRHHLAISIMVIGYPLGGAFGSLVLQPFLDNDWRTIFQIGAAATFAFIPLVYFFVPESVHWLARKQPPGALEQINRTLARMGHALASALPDIPADVRKRSIGDIFAPGLAMITVLITTAYFLHITTFYFVAKWVPKILTDMGFAASAAGGVLGWLMLGGAIGGATFGILTHRFGIKALTIGALLMSFLLVAIFGRSPEDLGTLTLICALAGFCINGAIAGLYTIFAQVFPTHVRAFGTGFVIGVGRGGSVLAPIIAGFLLEYVAGVPTVALLMSLGSLLAAGCLFLLRLGPGRPGEGQSRRERDLKEASTTVPAR
jgi:benzoate transport